jgi:hypothetical protein
LIGAHAGEASPVAGAKLTAPVAARVLAGEPIERIEVATLEKLARAFHHAPWDFLRYDGSATPKKSKARLAR